MVNPQKENGYTPIANEIMEQLVKTELTGQEFRLALLVLRKTYGFHKKVDAISFSQMAKTSSLRVTRCAQVMGLLRQKNIITIAEKCKGKTNKYRFNKHYEQWRTIAEKCNSAGTIAVLRKGLLQKTVNTKDIITKEITTEPEKPAEVDSSHLNGKDVPIPQGSAVPPSRAELLEIVEHFKTVKGYTNDDLDDDFFPRNMKAAKNLFRSLKSVAECKACITWVSEQGYHWELETCKTKIADFRKGRRKEKNSW